MKNIKCKILFISLICSNLLLSNINLSHQSVDVNILEETSDFIIVEYKINNLCFE